MKSGWICFFFVGVGVAGEGIIPRFDWFNKGRNPTSIRNVPSYAFHPHFTYHKYQSFDTNNYHAVARYNKDPEYKKQIDEENRQKFLANKAKEEPEPKFGIVSFVVLCVFVCGSQGEERGFDDGYWGPAHSIFEIHQS